MRNFVATLAALLLIACSGTSGPTGATGSTGLDGKPGLTWRGPWSSPSTYASGDVVESSGSAYVATGSIAGAQPPAAPWQLLAASSVAQTVDVAQVVAPVVVSEVTAPVAVSGVSAPVAVSAVDAPVDVSGIAKPVVVSHVQDPVSVTGTVAVYSSGGLPVYLTSGSYPLSVYASSPLPVSMSGGISISNIGGVTAVKTPDFDSGVTSGDNSGGTVVPCPASIAAKATTCRRVTLGYGPVFLTDFVATARDDVPTAARMAFAFATSRTDSTVEPRWRVALRYVQPQGGAFVPVTSTLTGARLLLNGGEALYLADSDDAIVTFTTTGH